MNKVPNGVSEHITTLIEYYKPEFKACRNYDCNNYGIYWVPEELEGALRKLYHLCFNADIFDYMKYVDAYFPLPLSCDFYDSIVKGIELPNRCGCGVSHA